MHAVTLVLVWAAAVERRTAAAAPAGHKLEQSERRLAVLVQGRWLAPSALSSPQKLDKWPTWQLNAALNAVYAKRHGYAYQFYLFNGPSNGRACTHPTGAPVISKWCRLPALFDAMRRYSRQTYFMYLDNDAVVRNMRLPLAEWLASARLTNQTAVGDRKCHPTAQRALDEPRATLWAWANTHWGCAATSGSFVVRGGRTADGLLNLWWKQADKSSLGDKSCQDPYDQAPFVCDIQRPHPHFVKVLSEDSFADEPDHYVIHRCGDCSWLRQERLVLKSVKLENKVSKHELATASRALLGSIRVINGSEPALEDEEEDKEEDEAVPSSGSFEMPEVASFAQRAAGAALVVIGAHNFGRDINDAIYHSVANVTWAHVLLVEASPAIHAELQRSVGERNPTPLVPPERVSVVNAGVCPGGGAGIAEALTFHALRPHPQLAWWQDQIGSFNKGHVVKHFASLLESQQEVASRLTRTDLEARLTETQVPCHTLLGLLRAHGVGKVGMLLIDTEGLDCAIVASQDWASADWCRRRPRGIVYEFRHCGGEAQRNATRALAERSACTFSPPGRPPRTSHYREVSANGENRFFGLTASSG